MGDLINTSPQTEENTKQPKSYNLTEEKPLVAADPIIEYMSREQLAKSIERTRKLMTEAAKKLDFIEAAQYRDELLKLEETLNFKFGQT